MTYKSKIAALMLCVAMAAGAPMKAHASSNADDRAAIQSMEAKTLNRLYAARPDVRTEVQNSVGYAVFSSGSLAIIWISAGYGHGVAHDNRTNQDTYMEQANAGVGLGIGAKDYNTVFVFHDPKVFHDFITTGLDLSGNADADAKVDSKGNAASGSADVLQGVRVYQLTDTGLLAQAMITGTKYWRDSDLNGQ